jgi:hypothetical protein
MLLGGMELIVGLVASRAPLTVTIPQHRLVGYSESFGSSNSIPSPPFKKKIKHYVSNIFHLANKCFNKRW